MKIIFLLALSILASCASKKIEEPKEIKPEISMEITGVLHPESIIYSPKHESFFVSNVASGNPLEKKSLGYLTKISKDGKTVKAKWLTGFRAPKGMAIVGDDLYVSDINRVVKINLTKRKITKVFPVKDAKFLNDVVADAEGNIYISDMFSDVLYRIQKNRLSSWIKDSKVANANGLYTDGKEHIIAVRWGSNIEPSTLSVTSPGDVAVIPLKKPTEITNTKELQGNLDGITVDGKGTLWISDWISGDIFTMSKQGSVKKMFNLGQGTADLFYAKELGLLLVPQMAQNKLLFIKI